MIEDKNNQNNEVEMFNNYKNIVLKCRKQINKNSLNMFRERMRQNWVNLNIKQMMRYYDQLDHENQHDLLVDDPISVVIPILPINRFLNN